jgi:hypothetical protein
MPRSLLPFHSAKIFRPQEELLYEWLYYLEYIAGFYPKYVFKD